jgi:hypothetical protein
MRDFNLRFYGLVMLTLFGLTTVAIAQPSPYRPQQPVRVSEARPNASAPVPSGEAKQVIAVTLWTLTISEASGPEAGELEGALRDKATGLPTAIGTRKEVADLLAKLKVAGLLQKSRELRLTAVDGVEASTAIGSEQPKVQATTVAREGRSNTIMYRTLGTQVRVTPVVDDDGMIQVGLSYETSYFDEENGEVIDEREGAQPITAPAIVSKSSNTVARVPNGRAVLVSSDATHDASDEKNPGRVELLILAAEIVGAG